METLIGTGNTVVTPSPLSTTTQQSPLMTATSSSTTTTPASPAIPAASALVDISTSTVTPTTSAKFPEKIITTAAEAEAEATRMTTISTPTQTPYYGIPSSFNDLDYYDKSVNDYKLDTNTALDDGAVSLELIACPICSRTFKPDTLRKHAGICQKMATKKRRIFDSQRQRREGTELAAYPLPKNYGLPAMGSSSSSTAVATTMTAAQQVSSPVLTRKKSNDEFVRSTARTSMRKQSTTTTTTAAPVASTSTAACSTAPTTSGPTNFIRDRMRSSERLMGKRGGVPASEQCPHCDRCFGIKAYDRHVEWCKEKALQASIKHNNKTEQNVAKERLEARTKYRAPCLKTKRSMNREKYSGTAGDDNEMDSPTSHNPHHAISSSMTSSMTSDRLQASTDDFPKLAATTSYTIISPTNSDEHEEKPLKIQEFDFLLTGEQMETYTKKPKGPMHTIVGKHKPDMRELNDEFQDSMDDSDGNDMPRAAPSVSSTTVILSRNTSKAAALARQQKTQSCTKQVRYEKTASDLSVKSLMAIPTSVAETVAHMKRMPRTTRATELRSAMQQAAQQIAAAHMAEEEHRAGERQVGKKRYAERQAAKQRVAAEQLEIEQIELHQLAVEQEQDAEDQAELMALKPQRSVEHETARQSVDEELEQMALQELSLQQKQVAKDKRLAERKAIRAQKAAERQAAEYHAQEQLEIQQMAMQELAIQQEGEQKSLNPVVEKRKVLKKHRSVDRLTAKQRAAEKMEKQHMATQDLSLQQDLAADYHRMEQKSGEYEDDTKQCALEHEDEDQLADNIEAAEKRLAKQRCTEQRIAERVAQALEMESARERGGQQQGEEPECVSESYTMLDKMSIKSMTMTRPKRSKLARPSCGPGSVTTTQSAPLKAMPLVKESIVSIGAGNQLEQHDTDIEATLTKPPSNKISKAIPPKPLPRDKSFILSGVPDNYDPFLSAKRQLEELCSPTTSQQSQPSTPSTPSVPILPNKMTSSLTLSTSTPNSSPLTNTQPRTPNSSTGKPTVPSNFRRTSSLRGPRRSPMLSARPFFAQKHRPTIQRGLSDEGPISTNFLKPEEYDEMPVRSVCVNDFAITNSPRVIRRDTSNSNRKQNLKLHVNTSEPATGLTQPAHNSSEERFPTASKYLSKTDSLAVFLKYENELAKLNPISSSVTPAVPVQRCPPTTPAVSDIVEAPVITKEFKDKSNTLSKQNSAKSIKPESSNETLSGKSKDEPPIPSTHLPTPVSNAATMKVGDSPTSSAENNENLAPSTKYGPIRLEPISKPSTPLLKPLTPVAKPKPDYSAKPIYQLPAVNQAINLNSILGETKPQSLAFTKERKLSSSSEYIDPKLINKCDNLPVTLALGRTLKQSDSDCSEVRNDSSSNSSELSAPPLAPISQLTKLLPLTKTEATTNNQIVYTHSQKQQQQQIKSIGDTTQTQTPLTATTASGQQHRNSAEGRNQLKRKIRLGRNQFLYDTPSPEADSCSADDEANRSSVEYDDKQFNQLRASMQHQKELHAEPSNKTSTMPPIPVLDDFDFEEFLSSFENDDEQFPLFKDCREFLMNRSSNKKRSTLTPNSNTFNNNNNNNNTTPNSASNNNQTKSSNTAYQTSTPTSSFPSQSLFQFPQLPKSPMFFSHPTSFRTEQRESSAQQSEPNTGNRSTALLPSDLDHKKREIFISIETEQNDLGRSPISPDSLRTMVGNPQAVVEVEVDGNDNKFSKISDDEPITTCTTHPSNMQRSAYESAGQLPNVQLNNAKNLIQKMQDDFRQMSEEAGSNLRSAVATKVQSSYFLPESVNTKRPSTTGGIAIPTKENTAGDAGHDSDDMSSLESYPRSSQSSRRGAGSKLSADSAYGSLSRQRSTEMPNTQRIVARTPRPRPGTANSATNTTLLLPKVDAATQHQHMPKYSSLRNCSRQREAMSSSGSENSLNTNEHHEPQQQQQQQQQLYLSNINNNNNNNNDNLSHMRYEQTTNNHSNLNDNHNYNICESPSMLSPNNNNNNNSTFITNRSNVPSRSTSSSSVSATSSQMTASMKMSKFCHECGSKFIIDHAKFCMDCGVKRIVL